MTGLGAEFVCAVCGYVFEGDGPPDACPVCSANTTAFLAFHADGETEVE